MREQRGLQERLEVSGKREEERRGMDGKQKKFLNWVPKRNVSTILGPREYFYWHEYQEKKTFWKNEIFFFKKRKKQLEEERLEILEKNLGCFLFIALNTELLNLLNLDHSCNSVDLLSCLQQFVAPAATHPLYFFPTHLLIIHH